MSTNQSIIEYESITPFEEETNYVEIMRKISQLTKETKESQWQEHVEALNLLLKLHKYQRDFFNRIMKDLELNEIIRTYLNSIRTTLSKCALTFLKQIFSKYEFEFNEENEKVELVNSVDYFLPLIISKAFSDKKFIKDEAEKCLNEISRNMLYGNTILTLLNECCEKSVKHSEIAFNTLIQLINNFEKNYLIYYEHWELIFSKIAKIGHLKKDIYFKKPGKVMEVFEDLISKEKFNDLYKTYCKNEDKQIIEEALEHYKKKTGSKKPLPGSSTENIRKFIQTSKQRLLQQQSVEEIPEVKEKKD